jgi:hypothetical protein
LKTFFRRGVSLSIRVGVTTKNEHLLKDLLLVLLLKDLALKFIPLLYQLHIVRIDLVLPLALNYELIGGGVYCNLEFPLGAAPLAFVRRLVQSCGQVFGLLSCLIPVHGPSLETGKSRGRIESGHPLWSMIFVLISLFLYLITGLSMKQRDCFLK